MGKSYRNVNDYDYEDDGKTTKRKNNFESNRRRNQSNRDLLRKWNEYDQDDDYWYSDHK